VWRPLLGTSRTLWAVVSYKALAAQVRAVGSELYRAGALQWELARLCSALALALEGNQLPLATGRPAFINAAGASQGVSLLSECRKALRSTSGCSAAVITALLCWCAAAQRQHVCSVRAEKHVLIAA